MKRRWVQGMFLAGMLVLTGCGAKDSSPVENGEDYTWNDITVMLPEDWADRCTIKEDENGFTIYQTASYEKMEGLGYLCSFEKSDAWMNYGAGENLIAYTEDGTLYYLMQPTDVACDTEDQTIVEEYGSMMEEVTAIASSVKIDADDVHYDADQYVVPVGAILPVTEENLSDLSEQELYLAANEIYARHGKTFDDTYLQAHFDACSWYTPAGGATAGDAGLSEIEQANLKLIKAMQTAYAAEHIYPKSYSAGETAEIALLDNGVLNEVSYTVTGKGEQAVCTLTIDGTAYDLAEYIQMHAPVADAFYVTDLVENIGTPEEDDGLEIAVLDEGTDGIGATHFFKYDGDLYYLGEVGGFPFRDRNAGFSVFNGQGGVMDLIRYDKPADCILQGYAWYNSSEKKIEHADGGLYSYYEPCKLEHKGALTVYFSMDETSAEKTIAAGEDIYCIRSDGDGWMYVRAKDGTEGFLPVTQM